MFLHLQLKKSVRILTLFDNNLKKKTLIFGLSKAIYELNTKLDFNCQYRIHNLRATPLCLDYWYLNPILLILYQIDEIIIRIKVRPGESKRLDSNMG